MFFSHSFFCEPVQTSGVFSIKNSHCFVPSSSTELAFFWTTTDGFVFCFFFSFFRGLFLHTVVHTCQYNLVSCLVFFSLFLSENNNKKNCLYYSFFVFFITTALYLLLKKKKLWKKTAVCIGKAERAAKKMYFT